MIDKLNDFIDLNLNFLLTEHKFSSFHLLGLDKKSLRKYEHLQLVNLMADRGLVTINGQNCTLTEDGHIIAKNGGWLTHLENEAKSKLEQQSKVDTNEKLDIELKILQKEKLEYESTIRDKEETIRSLTIKLKRMELFKQYYWLLGIILAFGIGIGKLWDIIFP
ncbi:MAG: hypothetical protein K0M50_17595 [Prolixibacteraceae bacterium]|nr:hypothetical protein [Prolixibacteraceae bacterium]